MPNLFSHGFSSWYTTEAKKKHLEQFVKTKSVKCGTGLLNEIDDVTVVNTVNPEK